MGRHDVSHALTPEAIRTFTKSLLEDLRALEQILASGMIEAGVRRFGAEQEMFLVDRSFRPAPRAVETLQRLDDPRFTTELARFNLEVNLDPMPVGGPCLTALENELEQLLETVRRAADAEGAEVAITGILPTLTKSDLSLENITPRPRYYALNEAMNRMRGSAYRLHIEGTDEVHVEHESVMLEACNTSFQVHLQVSADEFAHYYNVAQAIAAPVLASSVNSPLLFGKRLWRETRIALFQQSVDTRTASPHLRELSPRVRFGEQWIKESVVEAFQEDIARFRVIMGTDVPGNPFEVLATGQAPMLDALQMHNSTVYRWNRPCYGVVNGTPHLRIECRALPAGPSIVDEVANAALWIGLMLGMAAECDDVRQSLEFDDAKANFLAAARSGLQAAFTWFDREEVSARDLILQRLLPIASRGLRSYSVNEADIERYLGVVEERVASGRTGAQWLLESGSAMQGKGTRAECLAALTAATVARQRSGTPCHEWELADAGEAGESIHLSRIEHIMTTDLFTVREDELVDLAAFIMDRKGIRHVLVEDDDHNLVGIISYRVLIRLLAEGRYAELGTTVPVKAVMEPDPVTITPEVSTLEAIELMRRKRVSALPVVKNGKLVGVVSERDFMHLAAELLEEQLRAP